MKKIENMIQVMMIGIDKAISDVQKSVVDFRLDHERRMQTFLHQQDDALSDFQKEIEVKLTSLRTYIAEDREPNPVEALTKLAKLPTSIGHSSTSVLPQNRTPVDLDGIERDLIPKFASKA